MKNIFLYCLSLSIIICMCQNNLFSQQKIFSGDHNQDLRCIIKSQDNYLIACGRNANFNNYNDGWIVKIDASLNVIKFNSYLQTDSTTEFNYLCEDNSNNIIVVGKGYNPNNNSIDGLICKYDKDGKLLYNSFIGSDSEDELIYVTLTNKGNFIATGKKDNIGWFYEFDSDGNKILDITYDVSQKIHFAHQRNSDIMMIYHSKDNKIGVLITDLNGIIITDTRHSDNVFSVNSATFTSDNCYVILTHHFSPSTGPDIFLLKVGFNGDFIKQGSDIHLGSENKWDNGAQIIENCCGNYIICGSSQIICDPHGGFYYDAWMVEINKNLDDIIYQNSWQGEWSLHDFALSIVEFTCGHYYYCGTANENVNWDGGRGWIKSFKKAKLVSPVGGERYKSGDTIPIKWDIENINCLDTQKICIKIEYSSNSGNDWAIIQDSILVEIKDSILLEDIFLPWIVPDIDSDSCLVRISECNNCIADISDSLFRICKDTSIKRIIVTSSKLIDYIEIIPCPSSDFVTICLIGENTLNDVVYIYSDIGELINTVSVVWNNFSENGINYLQSSPIKIDYLPSGIYCINFKSNIKHYYKPFIRGN